MGILFKRWKDAIERKGILNSIYLYTCYVRVNFTPSLYIYLADGLCSSTQNITRR